MLAVPIMANGQTILILILQKENLVRMKDGDPVDLETSLYLGAGPKLVIAYEEDDAKLAELVKGRSLKDLIAHLERGRTVYAGEVQPPKKWEPK